MSTFKNLKESETKSPKSQNVQSIRTAMFKEQNLPRVKKFVHFEFLSNTNWLGANQRCMCIQISLQFGTILFKIMNRVEVSL